MTPTRPRPPFLVPGLLALAQIAPLAASEAPEPVAPAGPATAVTVPSTAADLAAALQRADELALHADPYWAVLLHLSTGLRGTVSRVDDPAFFLAADGKSDPRAELRADLQGFFEPLGATRHAVERFPARFEWLVERLGLERARLPVPRATEIEEIIAALQPRSAALVFPAAYMNTPASMFGHTMLTIRGRNTSALLDQTVNYAALTTESNGIVFATKGILGLYPGYYSLMPYYQKVQEYADLDQRDLWEYELALGVDDLRRMLLHIWELRGIASDYYFFDENCSYNLLFLIDAARPGLAVHRTTGAWVIPLDTVRSVVGTGLVARTTYRPSRANTVRALAEPLDGGARSAARALARGSLAPAAVRGEPLERAKILDLASEYLRALRGRRKVAQGDYQGRLHAILSARSAIAAPPAPPAPAPIAPDRGHGSRRIGFGLGRAAEDEYGEIQLRPAYHDLLDPADGYLPGSQIGFTELTLRLYREERRPVVERFDVITLRSLAARDGFFAPIAWTLDAGAVRERMDRDHEPHLHARLGGGAGAAYELGDLGLGWALVEADSRWIDRDPHHAIGFGGSVGAALLPTPRISVGPFARHRWYVLGDTGENWEVGGEARFQVAHDAALAFEAGRHETWDSIETRLAIRALFYF
jgi:hypothetical protein